MNKLYLPKAKELGKIFLFLGFQKTRQKGSHIFYKHFDGRVTTIPYHRGKDREVSEVGEVLLGKATIDA